MTTTLPVVARILAAPFAFVAPINAVIANAAGMTSDVIAWLLVALVGGIVVACMTPIVRRQRRAEEAERRRRAREYREQWFGSFERRQRVKGARP
ncbi:hypothetical protein A5656_02110 [Mycobacterium gordonae]|nr:hypothetical protein [Mycobacterium gordonae]OBK58568.1 hypothetical protein A5656_02110 [Mycobacterium gordonae]